MAKKFYSLLPAIILSTLGVIILVFAWTEPTNSPPQGNVPAPLNVGLEEQIKEGGLWIASNPTLTTGLIVQYGNVGIGTTTPSYKLDVVGKANAGELCISGDCKSSWAFVGESVGFGDGSDGDVTISSDTSLSRDMYYNNLTINPGVTLNPNGYRIFVKGTLINNGKISRNGNPGQDGNVGRSGGAPLSSGTLFGSAAGGWGGYNDLIRTGDSYVYNYRDGANGENVVGIGGNGGGGGRGVGRYGSSPGLGGIVTKDHFYFVKRYVINIDSNFIQENLPQTSQLVGYSLTNRELFKGGGGGGGGGASEIPGLLFCLNPEDYCRNTSAGGGGGSAGGIIYIGAKKIINNGAIEAKGGNGGKGGRNSYNSSNADQVCGGGGGGGGAGGIVILVYNSYEGGGSIDVSGGIGGDPGPQGSCSTPAERGQDGAPGKVIKIQVP